MRRFIFVGCAVLGLASAGTYAAVEFVDRRDGLLDKREAIRQAWMRVDAVLRLRAGLAPDWFRAALRAAPGGAAGRAAALAEAASRLNAASERGERIAANEALSEALSSVVRAAEEGSAADRLARIRDELAQVDDRLAIERRRYNEAVQDYNTAIQLFPNNLIAAIVGLRREEAYFRSSEETRRAPPPARLGDAPAEPEPKP